MRNSNSNSKRMMSNSLSSLSNPDWSMLGMAAIVILLFSAYYLSYKYNNSSESFENDDSDSNEAPNLNVASGEKVVALFYADWCPHCVAFKPDYKKAMTQLNGKKHKNKNLRFVMVDCDKYKSLSKENDVSGFPTVKILNDDKTSSEYSGERTIDGLKSYFS